MSLKKYIITVNLCSQFLRVLLFTTLLIPVIPLEAGTNNSAQLDLRQGALSEGDRVTLDTEWDFYWGSFVSADTSKWPEPDVLMTGQYWNDLEVDGQFFPPRGFATYKLQILLPPELPGNMLGFLVRENNIASNYFVNGRYIGGVGRAHLNPEEEQGSWLPTVLPFMAYSDTLELVIHTSNHRFRNGGLGRPIIFGHIETVQGHLRNLLNRDLFLIGLYIALALYHLGIFILRPTDRYSLWLFVIFLLWAFKPMFSVNYVAFLLFEPPSWHIQMKLEYLSLFLVVPITVLYFIYRYKAYTYRYVDRIIWGILAVFCISLLSSNTYFISKFAQTFIYLVIPISFIPLMAIWQAARDGKMDAKIILAGTLILFVAVINDVLFTLDIISTTFMAPNALLLFMFGQAFLVAKEYSDAFNALETEVVLRAEAEEQLRDNQQHLEQIVGQRTSELAETNQQLELENREKEKRELVLNELLETKNRFFSIIAHDLRGPLSSAASLTEVLAENPERFTQSEIEEILVNVHKSNKRIYGLLENLLDWAKLQLGTMQFELETIPIDTIIIDTFEDLRSQADHKQVRVRFELDSDTQVQIDKNMLSTAIRNLISNAIKFSHEGGEILVKAGVESKAGDLVHINIIDSGLGIPEKEINTLFDMDRQFHLDGTAGEPSSGLGLLLVKELVEKNNGQVTVVSVLDKGSTFTITLPVSN
ncbi:MAG: sensor histidine kinase [Candidatus Marinimicrobia bacterium]|jgi:signal transduction histidine kinase|nr:sensor histidine kinase [Candidatus Neomarinimicrobiota bacterium]MBT4360487.1 sensor histidine kinase [Candidatus Neomarinimicrobiota bacterium]MBT4716240.1 sensor histidine kinase [Candidatus Neomarinimicrobiota bacterium]MBT4945298.1 sensor histidine kinase [Candidatus Neomarinimicrobiota bacterium]MBT5269212.1 sensor histidine kinase [Candidatus Neomarinimicrobiota bacterium]